MASTAACDEKILISVIIPAYNAGGTIRRCLESVFSQTAGPVEAVCVNDGSTDDTLEILYELQNTYNNLVVINQENKGPSEARNAGLKSARGEYIGFVDSDDTVDPDMYGTLTDAARKYGLEVAMCAYENVYEDGRRENVSYELPPDTVTGGEDFRRIIYPSLMRDGAQNGACNKVYLKSFIDRLDLKMPEGLIYGEDLVFQLAVFDAIDRIYFTDRAMYHYIHRSKSLTSVKKDRFFNVFLPMYKIRKMYAKKWGVPPEIPAEYFVYYAIMDLVASARDLPVAGKAAKVKEYLKNGEFREALNTGRPDRSQYTPKIRAAYSMLRLASKIIK